MKKQTAVEWLEKRAEEREKNNPNESAFWHLKELQKDFNQALEMEKQQLESCYNNGSFSLLEHGHGETFNEYYTKTFKQ